MFTDRNEKNQLSVLLDSASKTTNKFFSIWPVQSEGQHHGWKLHLSVQPSQLKKTYQLIYTVIANYGLGFKVLNIDFFESKKRKDLRLYNGAQFTIYLEENEKPTHSVLEIREMIDRITKILIDNSIFPGQIPDSDAKTISKYFSLRNDKSVLYPIFQKNKTNQSNKNYIPAKIVGKNFNPENYDNPFFDLVLPQISFDIKEHFLAFNMQDKEYITLAFFESMIAYLHEHTRVTMLEENLLFEFSRQCQFFNNTIDEIFLKKQCGLETIFSIKTAFQMLALLNTDNPGESFCNTMNNFLYPFENSFQQVLSIMLKFMNGTIPILQENDQLDLHREMLTNFSIFNENKNAKTNSENTQESSLKSFGNITPGKGPQE